MKFKWIFNQHLESLTQEEPFTSKLNNFPLRRLTVTDEYVQTV